LLLQYHSLKNRTVLNLFWERLVRPHGLSIEVMQ
jgi:hypothetical protein